jgi:glycopeptide antibiotics resistance protein
MEYFILIKCEIFFENKDKFRVIIDFLFIVTSCCIVKILNLFHEEKQRNEKTKLGLIK